MEQLQERSTPRRAGQAVARFERYSAAHGRVEGWFQAKAAATWDALLERQRAEGIGGHLLEMGVWHGKSAAMLGLHAEFASELLILVDAVAGPAACRASLDEVGVPWSGGIHHLELPSEQLAGLPLMQDGGEAFRWIHINGDSTFGAVMRDMAIADTLLSKGGILCVDNFNNGRYPQVADAVLRYVREHAEQISLFLSGSNKAYLARPQYLRSLQGYCAGPLADDLEDRGVQATIGETSYPGGMHCLAVGPRAAGKPDSEQAATRS